MLVELGDGHDPSLLKHYEDVHKDHWAYLEALRARDVAVAEEVAIRHVELFQTRIQRYLEANAVDGIDFSGMSSSDRSGNDKRGRNSVR